MHNELSPHTFQDGSHQKTKDNKCWLGCGEIGNLAHCGNVKWCSHCRKQQRLLKNYHMIQKLHFWVIIQENSDQGLEDILPLPCSLQHYSQQPGCENNLNVHQQMCEKEMWLYECNGILFSIKKRKFCNMGDNMGEP